MESGIPAAGGHPGGMRPAISQLLPTLPPTGRRQRQKAAGGSRPLPRDGVSSGKGGSRKGIAVGQLLLPWGGGGPDLPLLWNGNGWRKRS